MNQLKKMAGSLAVLLCLFGGCVESKRQPVPVSSGATQHPSSQPLVLDATPRDYAAPYIAPTPYEVPTHCNNLPTQHMVFLCEFARSKRITMIQANAVLTISGVDAGAKLCGFTLTDNFKADRNDILMEIANGIEMYDTLVRTWEPGGIYDIKVWCKQRYAQSGPRSQWKYFK